MQSTNCGILDHDLKEKDNVSHALLNSPKIVQLFACGAKGHHFFSIRLTDVREILRKRGDVFTRFPILAIIFCAAARRTGSECEVGHCSLVGVGVPVVVAVVVTVVNSGGDATNRRDDCIFGELVVLSVLVLFQLTTGKAEVLVRNVGELLQEG